MQESLNEKLQRVESSLTTIKNNLHFEANAVIEEVAASTDIKRVANIYIQENEPEKKEGIWIQADSETHPCDDYIVDEKVVIANKWETTTRSLISGASIISARGFAVLGDNIYLYRAGGYSDNIQEYDRKTMKPTGRTVSTGGAYDTQSKVMTDGKRYVYGIGYDIGVLDTVTGESKKISAKPSSPESICYCSYNDCIYTGTSYYGAVHKIDPHADTSQRMFEMGTNYKLTNLFSFAQYLIIIGANGNTQVKDVSKNYANVTIPTSLSSLKLTAAQARTLMSFELGEFLYITNGKDYTIRINKTTFELEQDNTLFADNQIDCVFGMAIEGNNILGITGPSNWELYETYMPMTSDTYDDNVVIITQAPVRNTECRTQILDDVFGGRFLYSFYDVYYYNTETGLNNSLSTYYGDGEKWIKFKN